MPLLRQNHGAPCAVNPSRDFIVENRCPAPLVGRTPPAVHSLQTRTNRSSPHVSESPLGGHKRPRHNRILRMPVRGGRAAPYRPSLPHGLRATRGPSRDRAEVTAPKRLTLGHFVRRPAGMPIPPLPRRRTISVRVIFHHGAFGVRQRARGATTNFTLPAADPGDAAPATSFRGQPLGAGAYTPTARELLFGVQEMHSLRQ